MTSNQPATPESAKSQDLTGTTLGNYVLIRRLGRGGMANVYLAQQTTLNRPVAIKILKPELAVDKAYVERFHREAQAAAALIQANIVQIYEVGEINGVHFIAQEYVRGQNLRQYLNRHTVVEPILAVGIMRQVAAALQKASEHGVIHRDIKPENIMIAANGEVKVTDFGLARVLDDERADLTQIGITMGTPLYMSPEQAEGSHVDSRSDLYSLGITAWHMFAGRPPFEGENALTIAVKHVKEELTPLSTLRPDLPKPLCEIIHKLASKNPNDRFQSPEQLIKQLRLLEIDDIADWDQLSDKLAVEDPLDEIGAATVPVTRLEVTQQLETIMSGHFQPWWKSPRLLAMIGLTLVVGLLAGALYAWTNPPSDPLENAKNIDSEVEKKPSAEEQYEYAVSIARQDDTSLEYQEKLWRAVRAYHPAFDLLGDENPQNIYYHRLSDVRLGELFLEMGKLDPALKIFDRLANLEESAILFRAVGLAGMVIVYATRQEPGDEQRQKEIMPTVRDLSLNQLQLSFYIAERLRNVLDPEEFTGPIDAGSN